MIIQTKACSLILDDKTGNITAFYGLSGYDYVQTDTPLITLSLLTEQGERIQVNSGDCASIERVGDTVTVRYENMGGYPVSAVATVKVRDERFFDFRLKLSNGSPLRTECILYPGLIIKNRLSVDGYKLYWSAMEGCEITSVDFRTELMSHADGTVFPAKGWQGIYPGACPMQFMAYYNGEHGLYFASHDEDCNFKLIEWKEEKGGLRLLQQVYADTWEKDYEYTYDVVLGAFSGNWYDAAEIYREWIASSKILRFPKLKDNPDLPKWILEPLTVITFPIRGHQDVGEMNINHEYYPYENCLPYIEKFQKHFNNRQMVLFMHWEGTAPWAPPYVWPPFGDKDSFDRMIDGIHAQGNLVGLYCSGLGWTQNSLYYDYNREADFERENLKEVVQVGPTGNLEPTTTCFHIRSGYELCPACDKTKQIAREEAEKIASGTDLDYLQFFDQDLGGNTYPCYSKTHGHPPVPGKWMAEEIKNCADLMKAEFAKYHPEKKVLIGCEAAACESLLDVFRFNDIRYNLDLMYGIPVPAYAYIFGEHIINYMGNHTTATRLLDTKLYPDNIYYRTAYSFAQGDVLTFMLKNGGKVNWEWNVPWKEDDEPNQEEYLAFAKLLNDFRQGILFEALRFGKMVKPRAMKCGKYTEKVDRKNLVRVLDEIVTTRFQTEDGRDLQIFVNFNRRPVNFTVQGEFAAKAYRTPNDLGEAVKSLGSLELDIEKHSVILLEYV